ncbi:MAG: TrkA C-terminal domain-containing protein [Chromatiales bacterium]|jgi:putative transport protein
MEIDVLELLRENWLILLFLVIGLGYLIGSIRIFGMPLGPTIGVLIAGLFFGHWGLSMSPGVASFGFALFIFSVGLQAGPSFFSAFREDGPKYIILAVLVAVVGFTLAWALSKVFGFENGFDAGLLAGGLTSTPTLAGAQDAIRSGLALLPEGVTADQALENVGVGYALTYLIGTFSVILLVRYAPRLLKLNLEAMARTYAKDKGLIRGRRGREKTADSIPIIRAYRVQPKDVGKSVAQRIAELNLQGVPLRIRRGTEFLEADPDLTLEEGDIVSVIASVQTYQRWDGDGTFVGEEVLDPELLDYRIDAQDIVVLNAHVVGRSLKELELPRSHGCWATGLVRSGIELPITDEVVLLKGDRLHIVGEQGRLRRLAEQMGYVEQQVEETDLVTFSFGIVAGGLLGLVVIKIAGISVGLGTAGGLLVAGICIGYLSSINPTFGRVPGAARYLLKELGLMLLMAAIGLNAGGGFLEGLTTVGPTIILSALVVALVPIALGYLVGRKVLKLNPALLLGSLTGAMTSTPALNVITDAAKSSVPAIGYAGTYTFANVLLTFAGTYMMMI